MKKVAIKFADINIIPYLCTRFKTLSKFFKYGEMAEWSNAPVLKTGVLRGTGGSNPSLSAQSPVNRKIYRTFLYYNPGVPFKNYIYDQ